MGGESEGREWGERVGGEGEVMREWGERVGGESGGRGRGDERMTGGKERERTPCNTSVCIGTPRGLPFRLSLGQEIEFLTRWLRRRLLVTIGKSAHKMDKRHPLTTLR